MFSDMVVIVIIPTKVFILSIIIWQWNQKAITGGTVILFCTMIQSIRYLGLPWTYAQIKNCKKEFEDPKCSWYGQFNLPLAICNEKQNRLYV